MEEKIENIVPQVLEGKVEIKPEELANIRSMLQEKSSIFIVKGLFPDIWNKEYTSLEARHGEIDGYFEYFLDGHKIPEDVERTFKRLHAFITSKSPEEIFEAARNSYEAAMKIKSFEKAYKFAFQYFDKATQDETVRRAFNFQYERMSKSKDSVGAADYAEVFFRTNFGELCLSQATGEQLGDIFEHVIYGRWARENGRALLQKLLVFLDKGTIEIKDRRSVRNFFHEFARETIEADLKMKSVRSHTVWMANSFEKHGLLSLDEDVDLFEELTKVS